LDPNASVLEAEIRRHVDAQQWAEATRVAILGYGPELFGFLQATAASRADAEDLFGELSERLWRKLPEFGWRSSFRTWAYTVARHLVCDRRRHNERRRRREVPWSEISVAAIADAVRSTIERSASIDARMELVRSLLDEDERTLLVLRIERRMRWQDIARIVLDDENDADDPDAIDRTAARLRKQFERIKDRLRRGLDGASR
jgi:RNA polymerase sigma-70 factor (ECF subfamily)